MKSKAVCIFSGGLDSTVLLYSIKDEYDVYALTFNYGQKHNKEIDCAVDICTQHNIPHKVIDLSFFKDISKGGSALTDDAIDVPNVVDVLGLPQPPTYVPNRNMMLLSIAASYAESIEAQKVFYGAGGDDEHSGYWDCTKEFRASINNVLNQNRLNKIEICSPLVDMSKGEIVQLGSRLKVDFARTWTCYCGRNKACGKCPTCANRLKGFISAGLIDPLEYEVDIPWGKFNCVEIPV